MSEHPIAWADDALSALRRSGYRVGGAREAVIMLLDRRDGGLTAQDIAEQLRGSGQRIGTASVYRAVAVLVELGLLHGLDVGQGLTRYELVRRDGGHSHHVVCDRCGRTEVFGDSELERVIERIQRRASYEVRTHDVILRGLCPRCASGVPQKPQSRAVG